MLRTNIMVLNEILNNSNEEDRDQDFKVGEILKDYNVKTEVEFEKVLNDNWNYIECPTCGKKIDILHCRFDDGISAICPKCGDRC